MVQPALSFCLHNNRMYIHICAWCQHIRTVHGQWARCEPRILNHNSLYLTHGICPACKQKVLEEIEKMPVRKEGNSNA